MMAALSRALVARLACFTLIAGSAAVTATSSPVPDPASRIVAANDNRHPAGKLSQGTLTLALRAGRGIWRPEGPRGPGLSVEALGETSSSLMVPAPLVRVEEGTTIVASIQERSGVTADRPRVLRARRLGVRDARGAAWRDAPGTIQCRPAGHLSLLGDIDGRARAVP